MDGSVLTIGKFTPPTHTESDDAYMARSKDFDNRQIDEYRYSPRKRMGCKEFGEHKLKYHTTEVSITFSSHQTGIQYLLIEVSGQNVPFRSHKAGVMPLVVLVLLAIGRNSQVEFSSAIGAMVQMSILRIRVLHGGSVEHDTCCIGSPRYHHGVCSRRTFVSPLRSLREYQNLQYEHGCADARAEIVHTGQQWCQKTRLATGESS